MLPYLREDFGNAASRNHAFGWKAEAAVEQARKQVAALIGASDKEIVFTCGATESDNLAIKGVVEFYRSKGDHIITLKTEHKAVLDTCKRLERMRQERLDELKLLRLCELTGSEVQPEDAWTRSSAKYKLEQDAVLQQLGVESSDRRRARHLPGRGEGRPGRPREARRGHHRQDHPGLDHARQQRDRHGPAVAEIGKLCRERGVLFHCDAVQGVGKVPFDVEAMKVDLASITAHKMYGPKGVGALYVRRKPRVRIAPIIDGGGHERGMRSGTLNVAGHRGLRQGGGARPRRRWPTSRARILAPARAAAQAAPGRSWTW